MKVLIIDDNPIDLLINRKMIQSVVPTAEVFSAQSMEEAQAFLSTSPQDLRLMFVDIRMPVMNGFEMLELLNDTFADVLAGVHVYMVSSSLDGSDARQSEETSYIQALLDKPLSKMVVQAVMSRFDDLDVKKV
ncbi:MAG: response regulator [Cryomorphaceae bacterium]|nr:response regulator [Cryomorphaceae bacterium]